MPTPSQRGWLGVMAVVLGVVTLLAVPIMLLNVFGWIVAGLWLAILGEWWALGYGLVLFVVSAFALSFLLMPGLAVAAPAAYLLSRRSVLSLLGYPLALLSSLYTHALMTAYSVWVFHLVHAARRPAVLRSSSSLVVRYGDGAVDVLCVEGA